MTAKAMLTCKAITETHIDAGLSNAFQLISHVDDKSLLAHQEEALLALRKLLGFFAANKSPRAVLLAKQSQPETPLDKSNSSNVLALLGSLNRQEDKIKERFALTEIDAAGIRPIQQPEEPKPLHLQLVNAALSSNDPFQKALIHRRLGLEYEIWELARFGTSKITYILEQPNEAQKDRAGYINLYVNECLGELKDKEAARKCVRYGIKVIAFERQCQNAVVSAVLGFSCAKFRSVKFEELPLLSNELRACPWIAEILIQKVDWYEQCQKHYDGKSIHSSFLSSLISPLHGTHHQQRSGQLSWTHLAQNRT